MILIGDAREQLRTLPERSVQCCITSPPYFGLRDYQVEGQLGLEPTPVEYVQALVDVFREVRRVLRDDGTVWLVLGDSYSAGAPGIPGPERYATSTLMPHRPAVNAKTRASSRDKRSTLLPGYKPKDLLGIPWMTAFALRDDGWYLRSEIIWAKPSPMPESVTDRCTRSHEQVFMLAKRANYYYDAEAIKEPGVSPEQTAHNERYAREYAAHTERARSGQGIQPGNNGNQGIHSRPGSGGRNKRSVWQIATKPYPDAHFAVFPPKLVEPMVLAGSAPKACWVCGAPWERVVERTGDDAYREQPVTPTTAASKSYRLGAGGVDTSGLGRPGWRKVGAPEKRVVGWQPTCPHEDDSGQSIVLDPFCGTATTGEVAIANGRGFVGIELSPEYADLARRRLGGVTAPLFA